MIFAGMSGSAWPTPPVSAWWRSGHDEGGLHGPLFAAVTAVSSTIGPIIPPSIPFVIYGSLTNVSVGDLFLPASSPAC